MPYTKEELKEVQFYQSFVSELRNKYLRSLGDSANTETPFRKKGILYSFESIILDEELGIGLGIENVKTTDDSLSVFRPSKGSAKVVIGNGVKLKGEITDADEVQIDGQADVTMITDNLVVGGSGNLKGTITSQNADVWGKLDGEVKVEGTLTVQEQGSVSGNIEYQNLQIKLGGQINGDIKVSEKIKKIGDIKNSKKEEPSSLQETLSRNKSI